MEKEYIWKVTRDELVMLVCRKVDIDSAKIKEVKLSPKGLRMSFKR